MIKREIIVLGSTGSIGKQTLEVVDFLNQDPNNLIAVVGLSAHSSVLELEKQIRKYNPKFVALSDNNNIDELRRKIYDTNTQIFSGIDGICEMIDLAECDLVLNAIVGISGLEPSITALNSRKTLALANKESLVVAGEIIERISLKNRTKILPVDSEHYAISRCICQNGESIKNLIITASGGAFYGKSPSELQNVTVQDALKHPTYSMGAKITIDSATMMNKALEIIEAHHMFGIDYEHIKVLIHPQSIVHSMVEFCDNSVIAQLSVPDMRLPVQSAITYPEVSKSPINALDFGNIQSLNFFNPDFNHFSALKLAYTAGKFGSLAPTVMNATNEMAVELFVNKKIRFVEIIDIVSQEVNNYINNNEQAGNNVELSIKNIIKIDKFIKEKLNDKYKYKV